MLRPLRPLLLGAELAGDGASPLSMLFSLPDTVFFLSMLTLVSMTRSPVAYVSADPV